MCPGVSAAADDPAKANPPLNKLTFSHYNFSSGKDGVDLNLRHTFKSSTAWIGGYRESSGFDQGLCTTGRERYTKSTRRTQKAQNDVRRDHVFVLFVFRFVPLVYFPELRAVGSGGHRGFLGVSLYSEMGHAFYSVYAIRDNRLGTGQNNTHLYFRRYLPHDWRLTADIVNEHGTGDNNLVVRDWSVSVDADWHRWFVRMARDPHVNYTLDRQVRVSAGVRF
jgi:hypothetical protein